MTDLAGWLVALIGVLAAVFGLGRQCGKTTAEQKQAAENAAAATAATEKRLETMKNAENARQSVDARPDGDVDRRLRERWMRPGGD